MTKYEKLMNKSDDCCIKAIEFYKKGENELAIFYKNASFGYRQMALKLSIEEGYEKVEM